MTVFTSPAELEAASAAGLRVHAPEEGAPVHFFQCGRCGLACPFQVNPGGCGGTGYATTAGKLGDPEFRCYDCCALDDQEQMTRDGRATLYLTCEPSLSGVPTRGEVSNWPGTMKFPARVRRGRHNVARWRYDAWFTGPDGEEWRGVQYGDNTQLIRCRRNKKRSRR